MTRGIELRSEVANAIVQPAPNASPAPTQGVWYLRLAKSGSTFTGSYSADGVTWTALPAVTNTALESASFGVYAFGVDQVASKTAKFDYFKLVRDTVAPPVNLSVNPSAPSGLTGWWTDAVVATAMATDDQPGQLYLEQKIGDGNWSEYTTPITFSADGTHTVAGARERHRGQRVRAGVGHGEDRSDRAEGDGHRPGQWWEARGGLGCCRCGHGVGRALRVGRVTLTVDGKPVVVAGRKAGWCLSSVSARTSWPRRRRTTPATRR